MVEKPLRLLEEGSLPANVSIFSAESRSPCLYFACYALSESVNVADEFWSFRLKHVDGTLKYVIAFRSVFIKGLFNL